VYLGKSCDAHISHARETGHFLHACFRSRNWGHADAKRERYRGREAGAILLKIGIFTFLLYCMTSREFEAAFDTPRYFQSGQLVLKQHTMKNNKLQSRFMSNPFVSWLAFPITLISWPIMSEPFKQRRVSGKQLVPCHEDQLLGRRM
jgi:hypothetical protein